MKKRKGKKKNCVVCTNLSAECSVHKGPMWCVEQCREKCHARKALWMSLYISLYTVMI